MDDKILLEARNLTKEFESGGTRIKAVDGVDFQLQFGESMAITGPSGSGKSTLLTLLAGMDRPTGGQVILKGRDLSYLSEDDLSLLWGKEIGFIFQFYHLLPTLTAEENVRVPLELAGDPAAAAKAGEWLNKVGLKERTRHLPSKLSGGEQQRVALARAMAPEPSLLFADEPTGNLDSKTGREMADLLFSLVKRHGTGLAMVTHEPDLARRADRVIELKDGRIINGGM